MDWSFDEYPVEPKDHSPRPFFKIGRFEVREQNAIIGVGGMGMVIKAFDPVTDRNVAIKIIRPEQAHGYNRTRFLQELRALSRFRHQNIAIIFEAGFDTAIGVDFFAMEFIEGALPLDEFADQANLSLNKRCELLLTAALAVEAIQAEGFVHSDLKPGNVLVDPKGVPKVVDFGIAAHLGEAEQIPSHGFFSFGYSPPELISDAKVYKASDVFSLGCLAYKLLAGVHPFLATPSASDTTAQPQSPQPIYTPPKAPRTHNPRIHKHISDVVLKALTFSPTKRYADASAFRRDLEIALRGGVPTATPRNPWNVSVGYYFQHRLVINIAASIIAILALACVLVLNQKREADRARRVAEAATLNERQARLEAESLRKSSDVHMKFVEDLLFASDIYNTRGRSLDVKAMLQEAELRLSMLSDDPRALALTLGALGRIASNIGQQDKAVRWLERSADLWRHMPTNSAATNSPLATRTPYEIAKLSEVLNHLAWAILGDPDNPTNRAGRAELAAAPAKEASELTAASEGVASDNALCYKADYLRMLQFSDSPLAIPQFITYLASAAGQNDAEFLVSLKNTIHDLAALSASEDRSQAKARVRTFLKPFLSDARPRLKQRMPWSIAQASRLAGGSPILQMLLGANEQELKFASAILLESASDLSAELLPEGHPDRLKIQALLQGSTK